MGLLLLLVLVLVLIGTLPTYGYSRNWGYWPAGGAGLLVLLLVVFLFLELIPLGFAWRPVYVVRPRPVIVNRPVEHREAPQTTAPPSKAQQN
jgi:hypothetical protein